jgi:hypothetical protein
MWVGNVAILRTGAPQTAGVFFGVETDEQAVSRAGGGGPQVPRGTNHVLPEFGVGRGVLIHVEVHELFSFGDKDVPNGMGQLHGFGGRQLVFTRIDLFDDRSLRIRKKLLRAFTGGSAGAMIVPVDLGFLHGLPFFASQ